MMSSHSNTGVPTADERKRSAAGDVSDGTTFRSELNHQRSIISDKTKYWNKQVKILKPKPKRPLSAYNIFFREERLRILADLSSPVGEDTEYTTKRRRTDNTRKIGFSDLGKQIGHNWHRLDETSIVRYQHLAGVDSKRYRTEMKDWKLQEDNYFNNVQLLKSSPDVTPQRETQTTQDRYASVMALSRARLDMEMALAASRASMMSPSYGYWPLLNRNGVIDPSFLLCLHEHDLEQLHRLPSLGYPVAPLSMGHSSSFFVDTPSNNYLEAKNIMLERRLEVRKA